MPIFSPYVKSIYLKHIDQLYAYALHLGFDEQVAMDAIHDVFYKLCINSASLEEITHVKFYLFRALKNRLIDIQRTNKEHPQILSSDEDICENMSFRLNVTVEDELIQEEDREEIRRKVENVLNRLTDRQREIIYLRYIQEQSYEEIAELMRISVESCRNLTSKAMNKLRENRLDPFI
ncbi:RNA polymerase sigma factor [Proteiniphilum sp. X52]|uniref:RNA polymerase sigma factor n=1 Tax=Proteiniphilum sp. X52 TaxID=2382159 RepID=UPI002101A162|nr:sigma-70 family RNA polymerase sigma factor [Proteiniphilum sp. X52]